MKGRGEYTLVIAICLVVFAAAARLLPHPANFAPMTAVAIFGGAVLPRKLAWWVPLVAAIISDALIGFYDIMPIVWCCYVLVVLASNVWLRRPTIYKGAAVVLAASSFFFVATNFAVWVASGMYAHSWSGLAECYAMALPFFRNTVFSDAFYSAVLFGLYAVAITAARRSLAYRPVAR